MPKIHYYRPPRRPHGINGRWLANAKQLQYCHKMNVFHNRNRNKGVSSKKTMYRNPVRFLKNHNNAANQRHEQYENVVARTGGSAGSEARRFRR
jgi:hypothetical protein